MSYYCSIWRSNHNHHSKSHWSIDFSRAVNILGPSRQLLVYLMFHSIDLVLLGLTLVACLDDKFLEFRVNNDEHVRAV